MHQRALAAAAGRRVSYREKVAAAGREGRLVCRGNRLPPGPLVCRSHAPPVGGRLTESWQPPAERASLCAVATAGREGRLVCRSHAPPVGKREATSRATLWSPQKACQQAFAQNLGSSPAWGADPRRRQGADPQRSWSADPHRSQSADPRRNLVPRLLAGAEAGQVPRACLRDLRCHELTRQGTVYETRVVNS